MKTTKAGGTGSASSRSAVAGGKADLTKFNKHFNRIRLVNQASSQPGLVGEKGAQFSTADTLVLQTFSKSEVVARVCVQLRKPGDAAYDQTLTLPKGEGKSAIGKFEAGAYFVRVIVDGILVRNIFFEIK